MVREVRTGTVLCSAGIRLAWKAVGRGPALICCNGVGVSTFFWKYVERDLSDRYTIVTWDYRGHGASEDPPDLDDVDLSIRACAEDLGLIQDELGIDRAVLLGHSMGCQVILERWRMAPARTAGLVPMLGSAGRVLDTFYDTPRSAWLFAAAWVLAEALGPRVNDIVHPILGSPIPKLFIRLTRQLDPYYVRWEDFEPYLEHLQRIDLRLFLRMVREAHRHDAFPWLHEVDCPTLVIGGEKDFFTPLWISRRIAETIPGAELLVLADGSHAALIEHPETINHRLLRFLQERVRFEAEGQEAPSPAA